MTDLRVMVRNWWRGLFSLLDVSQSPAAVQLRAEAMLSLQNIYIRSATGSCVLDASQAEIVQQTESVAEFKGNVSAVYVTQVVRNQEGEYFLLKSTDGKPYVKHLHQNRAKHVLGSIYIAP